MLSTKEKTKLIEKFKTHEKDTGSTEIQIAILSEEIKQLATHLKRHPKDNHSRRGLLGMVAQRKKFLDYLARKDLKRYAAVAKKIGLKRSAPSGA
ncbi:MAG: 30S ribosomal protein S15 [Candidatus Sungbacteria bacterium]|uniref:Small ribosomal subunit protein uS15 n=1 Tax=Candidatus Sungiibacteriota bacterium TaxID=2750080 RepID=A0A933DRH9_9BACT|nr:30S ribosomal protein S15 [Candidatus Sungbacteria bacterium]